MQKRKLGNSNLESIKIRVLVGRRIRKPDASSKNARSFNPGIPAQMRLEHPLFYALQLRGLTLAEPVCPTSAYQRRQ